MLEIKTLKAKPDEGKPFTPKDYKVRLQLMFQCQNVLNVLSNRFLARRMTLKSSEKQSKFSGPVIHVNNAYFVCFSIKKT